MHSEYVLYTLLLRTKDPAPTDPAFAAVRILGQLHYATVHETVP
jgi:hypothetical protein